LCSSIENDFFDPTRSRTWMGSTTGASSIRNLGHAATPPTESDVPSPGAGTWIENELARNHAFGDP